MGLFWAPLGRPWATLVALMWHWGVLLGATGALLGCSWALLGCPGALSRRPKGAQDLENEHGASTGCLDGVLFFIFPTFCRCLASQVALGVLLDHVGALFDASGAPSGRPWEALGRPWGDHVPPLWHLRGTGARYRAPLGRSWVLMGCPGERSRRPKGAQDLENEHGASTGCYFSYFLHFADASRPRSLLGCFWIMLGRSLMLLEHPWGALGTLWDALWATMSDPCGTRLNLGRATGRCWGALGRSWGAPGRDQSAQRRPRP